jgi:hypothetical protein
VQVVVLLLLVAGLALLVLGLMTGSTPLVVASIAASLLAAMAILRYRRRQQAATTPSRVARTADEAPDEARDGTTAQAPAPARAAVAAEPAQAAAPPGHAAEPAGQVAAPPARAAEPDRTATELADADDLAEPDPAEADTDPPLRSRGDEPVWVIDGRRRYHLPSCAFLRDRRAEPVPLRQAVEDGFTSCALCDPDSGLAFGSITG